MIERIKPVIRGWGAFYRKAEVRRLFHRLDGWMVRRLYASVAKRWRNTRGRRSSTSRFIRELGVVRLTPLMPGLVQR